VATALLVLFVAAHGAAARSVEAWRFGNRCARMRNRMTGTELRVLPSARAHGEAVVIAPAIWNPIDYRYGVLALLAQPVESVTLDFVPWREGFERRLTPGGELDLEEARVFTTRDDGEVVPLQDVSAAPLARWEASARANAALGYGPAIAVFRFRPDAP
jgi:hypothetical protein